MFAFLWTILVTALLAGSTMAAPVRGLVPRAEAHTISMVNRCGKGTPMLLRDGVVLSTGEDYTHQGVFDAAIAYLQDGSAECSHDGENCSTLEITLKNPPLPGAGSSVDVTLIPPHVYSDPISFAYKNGCDGQGQSCSGADCEYAFRLTDDYFAQVQCEIENVGLEITFC